MNIGDDMSSYKWRVIKEGNASTLEETLNIINKGYWIWAHDARQKWQVHLGVPDEVNSGLEWTLLLPLRWIPICIFKESHCQGLSSAMSWIVYAWKITNQMFCSLWWSFAIIFFALFMIYRFLKHLPRLWSDLSLKEVLLRSTLALPHWFS